MRSAFLSSLVAAGLGLGAAPLPAQDAARAVSMSPYFTFTGDGSGIEALAGRDARGAALANISLRDDVAVFGPADLVLLLARRTDGAMRAAALIGADGAPRARFTVPAARDARLGAESVVLTPACPHRCVAPFELEFLDLQGRTVGAHEIPGLRLVALNRLPGDHWCAQGIDADGVVSAHLFDARGAKLWSFTADTSESIQVATGASAAHAALWLAGPRPFTARLVVLDAAGGVVRDEVVPAFSHAAFAPDGHTLALAGDLGLRIQDVVDGGVRLELERPWRIPPGASLAFAADGAGGTRLLVLAREGDDARAALHRFTAANAWAEDPPRAIPNLDGDEAVIALLAREDGSIRIFAPRAETEVDS